MSNKINEEIIEQLVEHLTEKGGSLDKAPEGMNDNEKIVWLVEEIKNISK